MTRMSAGEDSKPRQDVLGFLVRRAENGVSIIYTEAIVTDYESAQGYPRQARLLNQHQVDAWKPVVEAIHRQGSIAVMQMFHCGRMAWPEVNPAHRIIAPSSITPKQDNPLTQAPYPVPEVMSRFDINHVSMVLWKPLKERWKLVLTELKSTLRMGTSSASFYRRIPINALMVTADR